MDKEKILKVLNETLALGRKDIPLGEVADYIPELGKADKNALGIALAGKSGNVYTAGDAESRFTIQSISKVISLCVALDMMRYLTESVWSLPVKLSTP